MNHLITGFVINCFWAFAASQRLCTNQPPNDRDPSSCCMRFPNPIDSGLIQVCVANNSRTQQQETYTNYTPKGNCVSECIANHMKINRGNGQIDGNTLARMFLNSVSGDRAWGSIVATVVDICLNETRNKTDELRWSVRTRQSVMGEIICHPISGYLLGCMNTELFKRCPNTTQTVDCIALQKYAINCHIPIKYNEIK